MIDMVSVQNYLRYFGVSLGNTLNDTFRCLAVSENSFRFQSYLYKTKKIKKNFKRTAISWHPGSRSG